MVGNTVVMEGHPGDGASIQRSETSSREMMDMFRWFVNQSTETDDEEDDSSSDEDASHLEGVILQQQQPPKQERTMVNLWRQKRVVPGFYGLVMANNEVNAMGQNMTKPAKFGGNKGTYERRSQGTCATDALTEASGHSDSSPVTELEQLPEGSESHSFRLHGTQAPLGSPLEEPELNPQREEKRVRSVDDVYLDIPADRFDEEFDSKIVVKRQTKRTCRMRNLVLSAVVLIVAGAAVMLLSHFLFDKGNDQGDENTGGDINVQGGTDIGGTWQHLLHSVQEFDNPNSYQSKALTWLQGNKRWQNYSDQRKIQRWVLACLYFSMSGEQWKDASGWISDENECSQWKGSTCNADKLVDSIELRDNGLNGMLPSEISWLASSLIKLDLNGNDLTNHGDNEHAFFAKMTSLQYLHLGSSSLSYEGIPTQFSKLSKLIELDVSLTKYDGPLDGTVFSSMSDLKVLKLDGNNYNSAVPQEFGSLSSLEILNLSKCEIIGNLSFLKSIKQISRIWLEGNTNLGGSVPEFIGDMSSLLSFSVSSCALTGTIPSELGLLTDMQHLRLNSNELAGTVPTELGSLDELETLELRDNKLSGSVPDQVCKNKDGLLQTLEVDCEEVTCSCCSECV